LAFAGTRPIFWAYTRAASFRQDVHLKNDPSLSELSNAAR